MQKDSQFWQGLYSPGGVDTTSVSNLNQPLLGMWELGRETIGVVAESLASLESHVVPVIPFAVLKIDTSGYFSGGSARVYKGVHRQDEVAVKILFCIELTPERVISFCNEASMLHALQHPNVVTCYGVAVMPPAICLVTEWCHRGSLYDLLHTSEFIIRDSSIGRLSSVSTKSSKKKSHTMRTSFNIRMSNHSRASTVSSVDEEPVLFDQDRTPELLLKMEEGKDNVDSCQGNGKSCTHNREIVVDSSKTNEVGELDSSAFALSNDEETDGEGDEGTASRVVKRLKSAATVMQSRLMGFGLGPSDAIPLEDPRSISKSASSRPASPSNTAGSLLACGDPSRQSLGHYLPIALRLGMVRDCCAGVAFLHSKGMMHCDIKSLNFLVTTDFKVKLADLGEARPFKGGMTKADRISMPKNINWSAPEILLDNGNDVSELADVWSLAVVAGEILTGEIPFDTQYYRALTVEAFVDALKNNLRPKLPSHLDDILRDAIDSGWTYDVDERCSAEHLTNVFNSHIESASAAL
eukprot:CAMPEP_0185041654 /NCGR_PEP_ID=MMETSP1103-20130426/41239_1 /TAXON_ID=36769 /ORGANISM="Paraphysomonas bandaiensis, Strain Caron Lab Isolate" /LENGTH=523 /DNA_ID=CAMNT_0027581487 /DNA_START=769 /DNA_END=2340 /DNA_ORIENTATION=+